MTLTDVLDTTGFTNLNSKIDAMNPAGNTNVTIGLVWGWHALTKSEPLTEASDPAPDKDKVIVVLTDGDNTQNRWTTSGSSIDARTALACANAKAENIKIYTVRVIDGDANLLRNCATKPNMYYNVNQASELNSVFSSIAQNLANLRHREVAKFKKKKKKKNGAARSRSQQRRNLLFVELACFRQCRGELNDQLATWSQDHLSPRARILANAFTSRIALGGVLVNAMP